MLISLLLAAQCLAAPVPKVPEPAWMANFRKAYELKEGEYVKRVAAPYIRERIDFMVDAYAPPKNPEADRENREMYLEDGKWFTVFVEQNGTNLKRRMTLSSMYLKSSPELQKGDNLHEVSTTVEAITGFEFPECVVDPKFKNDPLFAKENLTFQGDFVTRKNAPVEKLAPQLEAILRNECRVPVRLRVDHVEQDVFVVSGEFKLKPPSWRLNSTKERLKTLIDIYATEEGLNPEFDYFASNPRGLYKGRATSSEYNGVPSDFVRYVGLRLKTRMVWDTDLPSDPHFSWCNHKISKPTEQEKLDDIDPAKVLKNVSAQTSLTFKKEKRKVPVLVIYPGELK